MACKTLISFTGVTIVMSACATQNAKTESKCFDLQSANVLHQLYETQNQEVCLKGIAKFDHKNVSFYALGYGENNIPYGGKITTDLIAKEFIHSGLDFENPIAVTGILKLERMVENCDTNTCFMGQMSQSAAENK